MTLQACSGASGQGASNIRACLASGDGYVHRLVQSKADGLLVEVPSPQRYPAFTRELPGGLDKAKAEGEGASADDLYAGSAGEGASCELEEALVASKLDAIAFEYNHLLASQASGQDLGILMSATAESSARSAAECPSSPSRAAGQPAAVFRGAAAEAGGGGGAGAATAGGKEQRAAAGARRGPCCWRAARP